MNDNTPQIQIWRKLSENIDIEITKIEEIISEITEKLSPVLDLATGQEKKEDPSETFQVPIETILQDKLQKLQTINEKLITLKQQIVL